MQATAVALNPSGGETLVPAREESAPDPEEIARLAYSFWEARGCQEGSAEEDWIRAEEELRTRR